MLERFVGKGGAGRILGSFHSALHKVTPSAVIRCAPLIQQLLGAGCTNGVIFATRFEVALKRTVTRHNTAKCPALWAAQITEHVRLCMAMVRATKQDC